LHARGSPDGREQLTDAEIASAIWCTGDERRLMHRMSGSVGYWHVEHIEECLRSCSRPRWGAGRGQGCRWGELVASAKDADGNVIGLIQSAW